MMATIYLDGLDADRRAEVEAQLEAGGDVPPVDMRKSADHKALEKRQNKYNAQSVVFGGIRFASKAEGARYQQLLILEKSGDITDLTVFPRFVLQKAFEDVWGEHHRKIAYTADFKYVVEGKGGIGEQVVVEDVKGGKSTQGPDFRIRWKWAIKQNPTIKFEIVEVN